MNETQKINKHNIPKGVPFGPGRGHNMIAEKPKDFKGTVSKLSKYLKVYKFSIILVLLLSVVATIFTIVGPKLLGQVTNNIVSDYIGIVVYNRIAENLPEGESIPEGTKFEDIKLFFPSEMLDKIPENQMEKLNDLDISSKPTINFDTIKKTILLILILYLLSSVANYIQEWIMSGITQKISFKLRNQTSEKINKLPLKYFDNNSFGDILSRITNDVDTLSQSLNQTVTQFISSVTSIVGITIMMISISWQLTIVAFIIFPISMLLSRMVINKSQNLFKRQQVSLGQINGHIEENYTGHNIIKAFNNEQYSLKVFNHINKDLYDSNWKSQFLSGLLFPIINFIGNISFVGVSVLGGWLAINKGLQIGDIQAFIQYVRQFNHPIVQLGNIVNLLQSGVASAERVFEFLEEEEECEDIENPQSTQKINGNVDFENVNFGYDKNKPVINNFSAKIIPGQHIAIIGPTGAGKTTIVNLLMRFYDTDNGTIKIDGIDIKRFKRADLRKLFGMVLQDTWLFNGTIKENLTYGRPEATDKEIKYVTKATKVDHIIRSLPGGYNMVINEDSDNVSQGEKQLLTIARAMLADSPMLILDEATSSVDTRTEVLIQEAMDKLMEGRTSFIIAHRLSTIKNADLILVMKDGGIVEQGTHEELLSKNGFYTELYNSQFDK